MASMAIKALAAVWLLSPELVEGFFMAPGFFNLVNLSLTPIRKASGPGAIFHLSLFTFHLMEVLSNARS